MLRLSTTIILALLIVSCKNKTVNEHVNSPINKISIFEIYLKYPEAVDDLSLFLKDTLQLPVEWQAFDFFGDGNVYDAAFYLGNTTLELLALYAGDSTMTEEARYNRILFQTEDVETTSSILQKNGLQHKPSFDFNIVSENAQLTIGKQINLDSLSSLSNVNIAFWEYLPAGFNFTERLLSAASEYELEIKLDSAVASNPMGIVELKEVHLSIDQHVIDHWHKLLGPSQNGAWRLADGPTITYTLLSVNKGVDWIKIRVKDLDRAKDFLINRKLLDITDNQVSINRTQIFGLKIFLEE